MGSPCPSSEFTTQTTYFMKSFTVLLLTAFVSAILVGCNAVSTSGTPEDVGLSTPASPSYGSRLTSGTPEDVGLRESPVGDGVEAYRENDGFVPAVGPTTLTVMAAGAETIKTASGATQSVVKAVGDAGKKGGGAIDWWINEAPKKD